MLHFEPPPPVFPTVSVHALSPCFPQVIVFESGMEESSLEVTKPLLDIQAALEQVGAEGGGRGEVLLLECHTGMLLWPACEPVGAASSTWSMLPFYEDELACLAFSCLLFLS